MPPLIRLPQRQSTVLGLLKGFLDGFSSIKMALITLVPSGLVLVGPRRSLRASENGRHIDLWRSYRASDFGSLEANILYPGFCTRDKPNGVVSSVGF